MTNIWFQVLPLECTYSLFSQVYWVYDSWSSILRIEDPYSSGSRILNTRILGYLAVDKDLAIVSTPLGWLMTNIWYQVLPLECTHSLFSQVYWVYDSWSSILRIEDPYSSGSRILNTRILGYLAVDKDLAIVSTPLGWLMTNIWYQVLPLWCTHSLFSQGNILLNCVCENCIPHICNFVYTTAIWDVEIYTWKCLNLPRDKTA